MAFLVQNIIDYNLLEGATIIAGKDGGNNEILWINLMEILDALDSLQKGELLITTGYQIDNEKLYKDIILRLKAKGLAGLAIQTGYYISEIPQYIISAGNKYDFPVINLPQTLTFSYITRTLIDNINLQFNLSGDSDFIKLKTKLETTLKEPDTSTHQMLSNESIYPIHIFLLTISSIDNNIVTKDIILKSMDKINAYFSTLHCEISIEWSGKKILFLIPLPADVTLQTVSYNLKKILSTLYSEFNMQFLIGTSKLTNINNLISSFNEALSSQQILKKLGAKKGVCSFEDIELFKMFELLNHSDYSIKFAYDTLNPVLQYDKQHKSSYMETLRLYLINECNLADTCSQLFIHRHTLKNRLDKIDQLCEINYKSYYSRMLFSMAIFIYDQLS